MTGGQTPTGQMSVAEIARQMEAEGVKRIIVTTEDPRRYDGVSLPSIADVRDRSRPDGGRKRSWRASRA